MKRKTLVSQLFKDKDFEKAALPYTRIKTLLLKLRTPIIVCGRVHKLENEKNPVSAWELPDPVGSI